MKIMMAVAALLTMSLRPLSAAPTVQARAAREGSEHEALRMLRGQLMQAINTMDVDAILQCLHPNAVVTWQNAEISRGRQGVREYLARMTGGGNPIVKSFSTEINVDELTALYGPNTGIAFGSSTDRFRLATGQEFTLSGRWTATLVREHGRWLIASLHASTNLFDNPLLNAAKKSLYIGAAVGFAVALGIGLLIGVRRGSRKR